jgi:SAM-dependent methyltransferase
MTGDTDLAASQRAVWDRLAPFWEEHRDRAPTINIEWTPPQPELDVTGLRVLELGCGDGRRAVELALAGATVLATDASPVFLDLTRARVAKQPRDVSDRLSIALVDATDPASLASLPGRFDLVVADMVLMNLVDLVPLAQAMPQLLAVDGRFTPLVLHPSFPSPFFVDVDTDGRPTGAVSRMVGFGQRVAAHVPERVVAALSVLARPLVARPRPYLPEVGSARGLTKVEPSQGCFGSTSGARPLVGLGVARQRHSIARLRRVSWRTVDRACEASSPPSWSWACSTACSASASTRSPGASITST